MTGRRGGPPLGMPRRAVPPAYRYLEQHDGAWGDEYRQRRSRYQVTSTSSCVQPLQQAASVC